MVSKEVRPPSSTHQISSRSMYYLKSTWNAILTLYRYGHDWHPVKLQVAFGKGEGNFWTNVFPAKLVEQFKGDIKKFGWVLNLIKYTMPILGLVPVRIMLRMFFFNKDFGDKMVYPLIALFLGTGKLVR